MTKYIVKIIRDENGGIIDRKIMSKTDAIKFALPRGAEYLVVRGDESIEFPKVSVGENGLIIEEDAEAKQNYENEKQEVRELKKVQQLMDAIDNAQDIEQLKTVLKVALRRIIRRVTD